MQTNTEHDEFVIATGLLRTVKYSLVSTFTVLAVDYLLTFPREIDLIWRARWTFAKGVYIVTRLNSFSVLTALIFTFSRPDTTASRSALQVAAFLPILIPQVCLLVGRYSIWATWVGYALGEIIFCLRTWAIWEKAQWVVILLVVIYLFSMGAQLGLNVRFMQTLKSEPTSPNLTGCNISGLSTTITNLELAALLLFETAIACLTLTKAVHHLKGVDMSRVPLLVTLYRDGLMFYVYTAAVSLANIIVLALGPEAYYSLIFGLQRVLHSILAIRVMLHIREVQAGNTLTGRAGITVPTFPGLEHIDMEEEWELGPRPASTPRSRED